jgi:hypothetical protein
MRTRGSHDNKLNEHTAINKIREILFCAMASIAFFYRFSHHLIAHGENLYFSVIATCLVKILGPAVSRSR